GPMSPGWRSCCRLWGGYWPWFTRPRAGEAEQDRGFHWSVLVAQPSWLPPGWKPTPLREGGDDLEGNRKSLSQYRLALQPAVRPCSTLLTISVRKGEANEARNSEVTWCGDAPSLRAPRLGSGTPCAGMERQLLLAKNA